MRKILTAALGILCGIAIIVMAFQFKTAAEIETDSLGMDVLHAGSATPTQVEDLYTGSYEWDKYYGGDAYSGIQQAAAQAANNVLALEDAINQTNEDLVAINKNLIDTNRNLAALNNNLVSAFSAQMDTQGAAAKATAQLGFFLLLAIGMLTEVKYLTKLIDGIAEVSAAKKAAAHTEEVEEAPQADEEETISF